MINILLSRYRQGHKTAPYPKMNPTLPSRFCGCPKIKQEFCKSDCNKCVTLCPTKAIIQTNKSLAIDLGKCLFCGNCTKVCKQEIIQFTNNHKLSVNNRSDLIIDSNNSLLLAKQLEKKMLKIFGRSLKIRVVSAGGCNGCELDVNALETITWDIGRFGIQFVASPRHADGILICGPITTNMLLAVKETYIAIPNPKIAIAVGACSISGGPYIDHKEQVNGILGANINVDLFIPGCPPHPLTIMDGFMRLIHKIEE